MKRNFLTIAVSSLALVLALATTADALSLGGGGGKAKGGNRGGVGASVSSRGVSAHVGGVNASIGTRATGISAKANVGTLGSAPSAAAASPDAALTRAEIRVLEQQSRSPVASVRANALRRLDANADVLRGTGRGSIADVNAGSGNLGADAKVGYGRAARTTANIGVGDTAKANADVLRGTGRGSVADIGVGAAVDTANARARIGSNLVSGRSATNSPAANADVNARIGGSNAAASASIGGGLGGGGAGGGSGTDAGGGSRPGAGGLDSGGQATNRLGADERYALNKRCAMVLKSPKEYDKALATLCAGL